jgi:HlyD family secretion protein
MKNLIKSITILSIFLLSFSCKEERKFDATGSFEAVEIIISAEATGKLEEFNIEEGQELEVGQLVGVIDSIQLFLKKKQLESQIDALLARTPDVAVQLSALVEQLNAAEIEKQRVLNLIQSDAATQKQLDDIEAQIKVIKKQIEAQKSTLEISTDGINKEVIPLQIQLEQIADQLKKCKIVNPVKGTVLTKYSEKNEMAVTGKALYKIADLSNMILRVYISANQLAKIKLNQKVIVYTDDGEDGFNEDEGVITWISEKAEFTPKTIQTKEERANLVYAVKIKMKNNGIYKIGMYGEVNF